MKKQIELCKVRPGEIFELDGERFARLPYEDAEAILRSLRTLSQSLLTSQPWTA